MTAMDSSSFFETAADSRVASMLVARFMTTREDHIAQLWFALLFLLVRGHCGSSSFYP